MGVPATLDDVDAGRELAAEVSRLARGRSGDAYEERKIFYVALRPGDRSRRTWELEGEGGLVSADGDAARDLVLELEVKPDALLARRGADLEVERVVDLGALAPGGAFTWTAPGPNGARYAVRGRAPRTADAERLVFAVSVPDGGLPLPEAPEARGRLHVTFACAGEPPEARHRRGARAARAFRRVALAPRAAPRFGFCVAASEGRGAPGLDDVLIDGVVARGAFDGSLFLRAPCAFFSAEARFVDRLAPDAWRRPDDWRDARVPDASPALEAPEEPPPATYHPAVLVDPPAADDDAPRCLPAADPALRSLPAQIRDGPCSPDPTPDPRPAAPDPPPASESDDDDDDFVQYIVGGKRGAIIRAGAALDSAKVGELEFLTTVSCSRRERVVGKTARVRVVAPTRGWVSKRLLEPYERPMFA